MNKPLTVQEVPASYQVMMDSLPVRAGYKQTEVGVVPEDWDACSLGDHVQKVGSGITPTGGERVYKNEGRPFLRSQNVGWGHLILDDIAFIDNVTHDLFQSTEIQLDDVFLNITGASIGRSAIANGRVAGGNVNQHVCIIRTNPAQIYPRYLNYFLLSEQGQQQIDSFQAGGNRQGLNFGQIRSFRFALPSIHEQRAIATALSDADALLAAQDQLIAKKRDIKQAAMQQLMTGKTRLPGFSGEWEVKRLGDLFLFSGGLSASRDQLSDVGYCYLHYGDIHLSEKTHINVESEYCDLPKLDIKLSDVSSSSLLKEGDVVFVDASEDDEGTSKHIVVVNPSDELYISGLHTIVAKSKDDSLDNGFKRYCFQTQAIKLQFRFYAVGTKVSGVSKSNIAKIDLGFPVSLDEQEAIATILSGLDTEITALEQQRDKTRALKQGMMQQLLTGKIRLIE
ncbi:MAG: restriction endonuclease subunit S [Burkholderiales bacterium]